ncbi:phosphatidylserine decarboxylase [Coprinopsis cinerea okayama7|uniref:Phosphatidylserine decarboxylase n=1 Tax=Coprinopsis cinerea (strain Okayama-7 / 130 / ATCC MYA-4618 / FGSC 9003) TaxID=240176 RepID=A8NVD4_COPC7|nr:phosphatidylserine decarboxylase [Coprinopsis cinerea okayama7\|eukprot:XP_001836662.1 phosphatidylserine decarboxylase [Coprinopsis cinerea okayama7\
MSQYSRRLDARFRKAGWLPASPAVLKEWLLNIIEDTTVRAPRALAPVIQEFKELIENDGEMYMGFNRMFENATGPVKDYSTMLALFNKVIAEAPFYGPIGPPFYMILNEAMNTQGGFSAFLASRLNIQFKKLFDVWAAYLESPDSRSVLNDGPGGWFSPEAISSMTEDFGDLTFPQIFVSDPSAPCWGFMSWDDFFVRQLQPNVRPLELPDNDNVINAACESVFYNLQTNVHERDQFWIKGEPYSLIHMLNDDADAPQFIGGTVFQGFLEVTGYHRWHAPVTGTVKKIVQVPGTYFVQSPALIGEGDNPYLRSLSFITSLTTRMLIFIESDNPAIGLMCFMAIGMTEVSTCEATVAVGQRVSRGDEIGMFHFGGSSHALIFRRDVTIQFDGEFVQPGEAALVKVRSAIGVVGSDPSPLEGKSVKVGGGIEYRPSMTTRISSSGIHPHSPKELGQVAFGAVKSVFGHGKKT